MSELGDLRRLLDFPDPSTQIKASASLANETEKRILASGGRLTEKSWQQMGELGLVRELVRRGGGGTVLGLSILRRLHNRGLLPLPLLRSALLDALPHPDSSRVLVAQLGRLALEEEPPSIESLKSVAELEPELMEVVLDWIMDELAKSKAEEQTKAVATLLAWVYAKSRGRARAGIRHRLPSNFTSIISALNAWEPSSSHLHLLDETSLSALAYRLLEIPAVFYHSILHDEWVESERRKKVEDGYGSVVPGLGDAMRDSGGWEAAMGAGVLLQCYAAASALAELELVPGLAPLLKIALSAFNPDKAPRKEKATPRERHPDTASVAHGLLAHFNHLPLEDQLQCLQRWRGMKWGINSFPVLASLVLTASAPDTLRSVCSLCSEAAEQEPSLGSQLVPVYLHRYATAKEADIKELIHRHLPLLATHRLTVSGVTKFCLALATKSAVGMEAVTELWRRHNGLLSQLLPLLTGLEKETDPTLAAAKAAFILAVCKERGAEQGEEVVSLLSGVLSSLNSLPELFNAAVEGVRHLCLAEVMEVEAAWGLVWSAGRRRGEKEGWVCQSLCQLLELGGVEEVEADEDFVEEALRRLWAWAGQLEQPSVANAAAKALAAFSPQLHTLALLPPKAKEGLKAPRSYIATPLDEKKPIEELLDYIPGDAFLNLCPSDSPSEGYTALLRRLVEHEVETLGRGGARARGGLALAPSRRDPGKAALDTLLQRLHAAFTDPALRDCRPVIGETLLLWYEPPLEVRRDGAPAPRAWFHRGRAYVALLARLLTDVRPQPADWRAAIATTQGWAAFTARAYQAILQGRISELEGSKGDKAEQTRRLDAAWLWARDQVVEALKTGVRNSVGSLASALAALTGLGLVVSANCCGGEDEESAPAPSHLTGPRQWCIALVETLAVYALPNYTAKAATLLPPLSGAEGRAVGVASLGLSRLLPRLASVVGDFLGPLDQRLFTHLTKSLAQEKDTMAEAFYFPLCLQYIAVDPARVKNGWKALQKGLTSHPSPGRVLGAARLAGVADAETANDIARVLLRLAEEETEESMRFDLLWTALLPLLTDTSSLINVRPSSALPSFAELIAKEEGVDELLSRMGDTEVPAFKKRDVYHYLGLYFERHRRDTPWNRKALSELVRETESALGRGDNLTLANALPALGAAYREPDETEAQLPSDYAHLPDKSVLKALVGRFSSQPQGSELVKAGLAALGAPSTRLPPLDWERVLLPLLPSLTTSSLSDLARLAARESVSGLCSALLRLEKTEPAALLNAAMAFPSSLTPDILTGLVERAQKQGLRNDIAHLIHILISKEEVHKAVKTTATELAVSLLRSLSINQVGDVWKDVTGLVALIRSLGEPLRAPVMEHWSLSSPGTQFWAFLVISDGLPPAKTLLSAIAWQPSQYRDLYLCLLADRLWEVSKGWSDEEKRRKAEGDWVLEMAGVSGLPPEEGLTDADLTAAAANALSAAALVWANVRGLRDCRGEEEESRRGMGPGDGGRVRTPT